MISLDFEYKYRAHLESVVDGDTIDVLIELGFETKVLKRFRLANINCPEMNTVAGKLAKTAAIEWLKVNSSELIIFTYKDKVEKYGRYLASVYSENNPISLNEYLLINNHAIPFMTIK